MRKICWVALGFIVMAGCKPKVPEEIIQSLKIRAVLYDIHLVDGYISTIPNPDSAKRTAAAYYKGVYKKFGIDSAQYAKSMSFYYDHPEYLNAIYKDVVENLKKSKDSLDKIQEKILKKQAAVKKAKQDSIEKADPNFKAKALAAKKATQDSLERVKKISLKKAKLDSLKAIRQKKVSEDSLKNVKAKSLKKSSEDSLKKVKLTSLKKAKRDSVEKAKLKSPVKAAPAQKIKKDDIPR